MTTKQTKLTSVSPNGASNAFSSEAQFSLMQRFRQTNCNLKKSDLFRSFLCSTYIVCAHYRLAVVFSLWCSWLENEFCTKTAGSNSHFPGIFFIGLGEARNTLLIYQNYSPRISFVIAFFLSDFPYFFVHPSIHLFGPSFLCSLVDIQNFPSYAISCIALFCYLTCSGRKLWRSLPPQTLEFNRDGLKLGIIQIRESSREREH